MLIEFILPFDKKSILTTLGIFFLLCNLNSQLNIGLTTGIQNSEFKVGEQSKGTNNQLFFNETNVSTRPFIGVRLAYVFNRVEFGVNSRSLIHRLKYRDNSFNPVYNTLSISNFTVVPYIRYKLSPQFFFDIGYNIDFLYNINISSEKENISDAKFLNNTSQDGLMGRITYKYSIFDFSLYYVHPLRFNDQNSIIDYYLKPVPHLGFSITTSINLIFKKGEKVRCPEFS